MSSRASRAAWLTVGIWLASVVAFGLGATLLSARMPPTWVYFCLLSLAVMGLPLSGLLYAGIARFETLSLAARWRRMTPALLVIVLLQACYDHLSFSLMPGWAGVVRTPSPYLTGIAFNAVLYIWLFSLLAVLFELPVADAGGHPIAVGGRPERRTLAPLFGAVAAEAGRLSRDDLACMSRAID